MYNIYSDEFKNKVKELEEYAKLEISEFGVISYKLCDITHYPKYQLTKPFCEAIVKEIEERLKYYKTNYKILKQESKVLVKKKEI